MPCKPDVNIFNLEGMETAEIGPIMNRRRETPIARGDFVLHLTSFMLIRHTSVSESPGLDFVFKPVYEYELEA